MSLETPVRVANELARRGYNADPEAVTLIAGATDPAAALERTLETVPEEAVVLTADHVTSAIETRSRTPGSGVPADAPDPDGPPPEDPGTDPSVSGGTDGRKSPDSEVNSPVETKGVAGGIEGGSSVATAGSTSDGQGDQAARGERGGGDVELPEEFSSTGVGEYEDFVAVFRDRYEKLSKLLRSRVNHRPTRALDAMAGNSEAALVGMVSDIRSTAGGHWLVELEDTTGTFPCLVMKDREFAGLVDELLLDEVIAVEGNLADDGNILFVDAMHFPEIPRTNSPSTADREVAAALVSDVHVGSQEFTADAWERFADWLHTPAADHVEYLLIAGDMVEGVGVYPDQDEELDIVDIYEQYERFSEHLKSVPGDMEVVMIPGNHDAVRLAEPQPAFDEELRDIMSAHDARIGANPATVTVEGVDVLMYHGVSLDEVIAELPDEKATYDEPHRPMYQLLRKRHVAPQFGGKTRLAPEEEDHLVIEDVPDVFHAGHVHKLGWGKYHGVLTINSGCWQEQTAFQASMNIQPDRAHAPIVRLDTLDLTVRDFR
ncbi:DNA polymerase II [Halobacteriales archaeon QS_5_68_33]|nr:MAG: DNA polymerase II [Halobacteriales archaeon QS_5_68_33]